MFLLSFLLACPPGTIALDGSAGTDEPVIEVSASPAFDPFVGEAWAYTVSGSSAAVTLVDSRGAVVRENLVGTWDGKDSTGAWAATGGYRLVVGEDEATFELQVVRAGLVAAYAEDDEGASALRVPLYWHRSRMMQDEAASFSAVASIDNAEGVRFGLPQVTDELGATEAGFAEPLAYRYDSRPIVTLQLADSSALGSTNLAAANLHVVAEGWTVLGDQGLVEGGTITLQRNAALGTTLGVTNEEIALQVQTTDTSGTVWTVAELSFSARFYRMLDTPTWERTGPTYAPWVAAVAPALEALEGTAPNREAVLDAVVRWIYEDNGLSYDTRYGASAYTNYPRGDWEAAAFDMGSFLDRRFGSVVNCTDCAGIVVGFGNMLGAFAEYAIIGWNFDLDYILAIGGDNYTRCPFGGGGCGFSYHAVTVSADGEYIWDATLALDGDDDSEHTPNDVLMVQTIPADEYLERLTSTPAEYAYQAQGTIQ